ncbi:MAG TPA: hypothetical protein VJ464_13760 [Blastocatellia bacterium]|nr:hypothetical protein [Blastocatellia bacterium]
MGTKGRDGAGEFKLATPMWERGENEPALWFDRFIAYLKMGRTRSKLAVYKKERDAADRNSPNIERRERARKGAIKTVPHAWRDASHRYMWDKRAEAFDEHEQLEDQERWREQHRKDRELEHQKGSELMQRASEMLGFALAKVKVPTGLKLITDAGEIGEVFKQLRTPDEEGVMPNQAIVDRLEEMINSLGLPAIIVSITQLEPVRWQMRDAALLAQTGALLMRQAAGAPTSYEQHEVAGPKGKDGQTRSLFPIKQIIIKAAPKRELPGLNGDAAVAEPLEHESPKSGANIPKGTD